MQHQASPADFSPWDRQSRSPPPDFRLKKKKTKNISLKKKMTVQEGGSRRDQRSNLDKSELEESLSNDEGPGLGKISGHDYQDSFLMWPSPQGTRMRMNQTITSMMKKYLTEKMDVFNPFRDQ